MRHRAMFASLFAALLALTASASAEEIVRHSGSIVAITLMPETQFAMVDRVDDASSGFPGDFVEVRLGPEAVYLNDYVTVECRHEGKQLLALKITVAELADAESGEETLR